MSRHPPMKWAQRSNVVLITIALPDAKDVNFTLQPDGHLHFSAVAGDDNVPYETDLYLYDKVDVDENEAIVRSRSIFYVVKKAEIKWWDRLLREEGRPPVFLEPDWDKWIEEEDEERENQLHDIFIGFMHSLKLVIDRKREEESSGDEDEEEGEEESSGDEDEDEDEEEDDETGDVKTEEAAPPAAKDSEPPVDPKKSQVI